MNSSSQALNQIYNAPILYKQGGQISLSTVTALSISACITRDISDVLDINVGDYFGQNGGPSATIVNGAVNGFNGLDTGTLAASTVYAVYAIADEAGYNPSGFLLSLSLTAPLMPNGTFPSGYNAWRRIGWAVTNASTQFIKMFVSGSGNTVKYTFDVPIEVLTGGIATVQTAVSLATCVPAISGIPVQYDVDIIPGGGAGDAATLCPSGGTIASSKTIVTGQVTTVHMTQQVEVPAVLIGGIPKVDYKVTSASDTLALWVTGFEELL